MASKKRFHPDGKLLSASPSKKLCFPDFGSSSELTDVTVTSCPSPTVQDTMQHGLMWSSASSVVLNSEGSISLGDSSQSSSVAHLTEQCHEISRDHSSCMDPARKLKSEESFSLHIDPPKRIKIDIDAEFSEVTYEQNQKTCNYHFRDGDGEAYVNSKRNASFLNSRSALFQKGEDSFCDSYAFPNRKVNSGKQCKDKQWTYAGNEVQVFHGEHSDHSRSPTVSRAFPSDVQKAYGNLEPIAKEERDESSQQEKPYISRSSSPSDSQSSYVLSSGRLSLEEEARLGRRAPTIDQDFEEYFSSLML